HDLPLQLDAARCANARTYGFAEPFDIFGRRLSIVDQEVAVHLRDHRAADAQATTPGCIDQLPGAVVGRVLEGRAAGALLDRLMLLAIGRDLIHGARDVLGLARRPLESRAREDPI